MWGEPMALFSFWRFLGFAMITCASGGVFAQPVDVEAAEDLARKSNCTKCHAPLKERLGPSLKATADKYRGRADAQAEIVKHITTGPTIMVDDEAEFHQIVKSKDEKEILNLVRYILSR